MPENQHLEAAPLGKRTMGWCVLHANDDPRADEILATAHDLLQERAPNIEDEELRRIGRLSKNSIGCEIEVETPNRRKL